MAMDYTTVNLGLSAIPEAQKDPKIFNELVRIYNAIKILAQGVDTYTSDGTVTSTVSGIADQLDDVIDNTAALYELRKKYLRYTVPQFLVTGKFACNGKPISAAVALTKTASNSPAGGTGTAAGGFDTAANRDAAIAAINNNAAAITEIQNILKQFGFAS
jgi:hypothetical protein